MSARNEDRAEMAAWRLFGIPALLVLAYIAWGIGSAAWLYLRGVL